MPRFLVLNLLDEYYDGQKIIVYNNSLCPSEQTLHAMANSLGVNYSPMFYRLQALNLLEHHPISELVHTLLKKMHEKGNNRMEDALPEELLSDEDLLKEPNEEIDSDNCPPIPCHVRKRPPVQTIFRRYRKPDR